MIFQLLFTFFILAFFPRRADAYIDAGSGSYMIQIAIASVVGVLVFITKIRIHIVNTIKKLFRKRVASQKVKPPSDGS